MICKEREREREREEVIKEGERGSCMYNETPTVRGLAADNNNKLYTETMIFLWNNHCNLNFIM